MEGGGVSSAGSRRSSEASTARRSSSKKWGRFIVGVERGEVATGSRFALAFRVKRFGGEFAIGFFQENFDAALGFLQLFLAFAGEHDAFFEKFHGIIERDLRTLEPADDFFQAREGTLKIGLFRRFRVLGGRGVHAFAC